MREFQRYQPLSLTKFVRFDSLLKSTFYRSLNLSGIKRK